MSSRTCNTCGTDHRARQGYRVERRGDLAIAVACPECSSACSLCGGERYVSRSDERGYEYVMPCRCQHLLERIQAFNSARIPARYWHCTKESYLAEEADQVTVLMEVSSHLKAYRPNAPGLLFWGRAGRGKTHLMVSILRELALEYGIRTRFVEFTHLLSDIKEGFNQGKGESEVLAPLTRVPVLGIDELGKGLMTEWQLSVLDEVISRRYNTQLTTYFTSNLVGLEVRANVSHEGLVSRDSHDLRQSLEATTLEERVGERIFSRLFEMCRFVEVKGPDARRRKEGS